MQNLRQKTQEREKKFLSPLAALSCGSQGRLRKEEECSIRTCYQRDRDRIIHSKAFRRLKHKTQVFISPTGDHYRTRLTHTLEVSQIARTIARALCLNEDLTEAVALGHDLGHTPFGHAGEKVLNNILKKYGLNFNHNEQSLHVADNIEKLNLTMEVRDGILNHPWNYPLAKTLEGQIVRYADRIAYINHDIDDSIRSKILKKDDIPKHFLQEAGPKPLDVFVNDIIENSMDSSEIKMSPKILSVLKGLYDFMYKKVYMGEQSRKEERKIEHTIKYLFEYYLENVMEISTAASNRSAKVLAVRDFIAGMTDRYAIKKLELLFIPSLWKI